jgi:hypothetical protein
MLSLFFNVEYLRRKGEKQKTSTWFLKYYGPDGKPVEVSSGTRVGMKPSRCFAIKWRGLLSELMNSLMIRIR